MVVTTREAPRIIETCEKLEQETEFEKLGFRQERRASEGRWRQSEITGSRSVVGSPSLIRHRPPNRQPTYLKLSPKMDLKKLIQHVVAPQSIPPKLISQAGVQQQVEIADSKIEQKTKKDTASESVFEKIVINKTSKTKSDFLIAPSSNRFIKLQSSDSDGSFEYNVFSKQEIKGVKSGPANRFSNNASFNTHSSGFGASLNNSSMNNTGMRGSIAGLINANVNNTSISSILDDASSVVNNASSVFPVTYDSSANTVNLNNETATDDVNNELICNQSSNPSIFNDDYELSNHVGYHKSKSVPMKVDPSLVKPRRFGESGSSRPGTPHHLCKSPKKLRLNILSEISRNFRCFSLFLLNFG